MAMGHVGVLILSWGFLCLVPNSHQLVDTIDESLSPRDKFFTGSPPLLQSLAGKEEVIYLILDNFNKELQAELKNESLSDSETSKKIHLDLALVQSYMKDFEETTGKMTRDIYKMESLPLRSHHVMWNPLASYHMIRRFSIDLKRLVRSLNTDNESSFRNLHHILSVMKDHGWPSDEDFKLAMNGILRVQHVYNLDTNELAKGIINGRDTKATLTGSDCYELGKHAIENKFFHLAVEWLEVAREKLINDSSILSSVVENDLRHAIRIHDENLGRSAGWEPTYFAHKVSEVPKNRIKRRSVQFEAFKGGKTYNLNEINFWGLCSGENYQNPEEKKKLFCWYEKKVNLVWTISPVKSELLSFNPLIVQYHDVLRNKMIEKIKRQVSPSLARSTVIDEQNHGRKVTMQRTSLSAWIPDIHSQPFKSVPQIIELMTGLEVTKQGAAEDLQVASYAFGGHYEVHMDALRVNSETFDRGDRIATFMVYLTDVEEGGSTAFPIAGVAARPIKGSAVFWYNLFSDGTPDERTWHGACPVILGDKWVANKWIRFFEQIHTQQCNLEPQTPIDFKVNGKILKL